MKLALITIAAMFLAMPAVASAQHEKHPKQHEQHEKHGHENRGHENHGREGGERHEHRHFDEHYRHEHFGREHSISCRELNWDRGRFFYGGVYWNLVVMPDYWLPYDVVYVDYVDGDYFLFNMRLGARVAIVIVD